MTGVFGDKHSGKYLLKFSWFKIERHELVRGRSSPDDPDLRDYWWERQKVNAKHLSVEDLDMANDQGWVCRFCGMNLINGEELHRHHTVPRAMNGSDARSNGSCYTCTATSRKPNASLDRSRKAHLLMIFRIRAVNDLLEPYDVKVSSTVLRGAGVAPPSLYPEGVATPSLYPDGGGDTLALPGRGWRYQRSTRRGAAMLPGYPTARRNVPQVARTPTLMGRGRFLALIAPGCRFVLAAGLVPV